MEQLLTDVVTDVVIETNSVDVYQMPKHCLSCYHNKLLNKFRRRQSNTVVCDSLFKIKIVGQMT